MYYREFDKYFRRIFNAEIGDILRLTGCQKPSSYKKYTFIGARQVTAWKNENYVFSLWAVSTSTTVETEVLVYPWTSLVAEFGGTLGTYIYLDMKTYSVKGEGTLQLS